MRSPVGRPCASRPVRCILVCAAILGCMLNGCVSFSTPELLMELDAGTPYPPEWESYGAFYEVDELFFEATFLDGGALIQSPVTRIIVNKQIRILTRDGMAHATVPVTRYGDSLYSFSCTLVDSNGRTTELDLEAMKREYQKNGAVVFPRAVAPCLLKVYIEFRAYSPLPWLEHWFSSGIPIRKARLTLSALDNFSYAWKGYGGVGEPEIHRAETGKHTHHVWTLTDVLPPKKLSYQQSFDRTLPRVSLVLNRAFSQEILTTWSDLTSSYRSYALRESFFHSSRYLRHVTDSLSSGSSSAYEAADRVFQWLCTNITVEQTPSQRINPDKCLKEGKADVWEFTVILRNVFEQLGLRSEVLVTRTREKGGFDGDFVTPAVLRTPLVAVTIDSVRYLAFPYRYGARLGDYPLDFFDLQCVSLADNSIRTIPEPLSRKSYIFRTYTVDPADNDLPCRAEIVFKGQVAYMLRGMLFQLDADDRRESLQKLISSYGKSNVIRDYAIDSLEQPGSALPMSLTFASPGRVVSRKGQRHIPLSQLFDTQFESYDTTRKELFCSRHPLFLSTTVHIPQHEVRVGTVSIPCAPVTNELFAVTCHEQRNRDEVVFNRSVDIFRAELSGRHMKEIYEDIRMLNATEQAFCIVHNRGAP